MDFNYTQEQEHFRQRVRDFLKQNLPKNAGRAGSPQSGAQADHQFLREWQRKLYDAGLLGISLPKEYGGGGVTDFELTIFNQEMALAGGPGPQLFLFRPVPVDHAQERKKPLGLEKDPYGAQH